MADKKVFKIENGVEISIDTINLKFTAHTRVEDLIQLSIATSLKRIADVMEKTKQ